MLYSVHCAVVDTRQWDDGFWKNSFFDSGSLGKHPEVDHLDAGQDNLKSQ